jgi:hypothetical protein
MEHTIVVTTLIENSVNARGLLAEHGLALHVRAGSRSLLFDTGQSGLLAQNARKLQVRLEEVEALALSHGHNDHTGGLKAARETAPRVRLFLHPADRQSGTHGEDHCRVSPVGHSTAGPGSLHRPARAGPTVGCVSRPLLVMRGRHKPGVPKIERRLGSFGCARGLREPQVTTPNAIARPRDDRG